MSLLCYDCNRRNKRKFEDVNKTNTSVYICLGSLSDEK